ncbi:hypothetical protein SAMN05661012_06449 [Chitinophaga sancti]|uniref:Uncharacterized protein n=1 Tax=Chitinophaga sancti TaxID=1004 RepID=A0A1K1SYR8_9BACT|nr:hypothetical protein SAMN05661012_06449 [Chitinophaga sancti]
MCFINTAKMKSLHQAITPHLLPNEQENYLMFQMTKTYLGITHKIEETNRLNAAGIYMRYKTLLLVCARWPGLQLK